MSDVMRERKGHAPENDDDGRLCIRDESKTLPDHET